jgi:hypothetical protein
MYYKLICILYALLCGQNFILVKSGCYKVHDMWYPWYQISSPSFLFQLLVELSWLIWEVTRENLQNLVSMDYLIVSEFATSLVLVDPVCPTPVKGYIVVCAVFYEWGFGVPSHRFLRSLLRSYGLELDHLTPLRILHMAAFVTMCEPILGLSLI